MGFEVSMSCRSDLCGNPFGATLRIMAQKVSMSCRSDLCGNWRQNEDDTATVSMSCRSDLCGNSGREQRRRKSNSVSMSCRSDLCGNNRIQVRVSTVYGFYVLQIGPMRKLTWSDKRVWIGFYVLQIGPMRKRPNSVVRSSTPFLCPAVRTYAET